MKYGYVQDITKSDDKWDYWTDCIGNGRDIRYDWDAASWVAQFSILGKEGNCRWENLSDISLDEFYEIKFSSQEKDDRGTVVAIGDDVKGIHEGEIVLFNQFIQPVKVSHMDEDHILLKQQDIWAIEDV